MKQTKRPARRLLPKVALGALALLGLAAGAVAFLAHRNVQAMDHTIDAAMATLKQHYTVTPVDPGAYREMTLYGLAKFRVEQYEVEELGNLSVMKVNLGLMQMATFVITPREANLPLLSADYMYILSNRKAYLEFYDLVEQKDQPYLSLLDSLQSVVNRYGHLEPVETTPAWYAHLLTVTSYRGGGAEADQPLEKMLTDSLDAYLTHARTLPLLSEGEQQTKRDITVAYTDGLIERGGISTDVFKSQLGDEQTRDFFARVFFGTGVEAHTPAAEVSQP